MKVLFLARYGRKGASSRLRAMQFLPHFESLGWACDISPLFADAYVDQLYSGSGRAALALAGYARRIGAVLRAGNYDLVWIEKELWPFVPAAAEYILRALRVPYVADYDDAWFHIYDRHPSRTIRLALGGKIDAVMRNAALVIAGNSYLAERALQAGARRVEIVPTVVDLERYPLAEPHSERVTVGWIGSPATAHYLQSVERALATVQKRLGVTIRIIGAGQMNLENVKAETVEWTVESEVASVASLDIGIMPLLDDAWARGKCGYKLIQYMACGLAVIASPVGVNAEIVRPGETGFLANSNAEWIAALERLITDKTLRQSMGMRGRRQVETDYSLATTAPRLAELFLSAARISQQPASPRMTRLERDSAAGSRQAREQSGVPSNPVGKRGL